MACLGPIFSQYFLEYNYVVSNVACSSGDVRYSSFLYKLFGSLEHVTPHNREYQ